MTFLDFYQTAGLALLSSLFAIIPIGATCALVYSIVFSYSSRRPPFRGRFTQHILLVMALQILLSLAFAICLPRLTIRLAPLLLPGNALLYIVSSGFLMAHQRQQLKHEGDRGDLLRARMFLSFLVATYYIVFYALLALSGAREYFS